VKAKIVKSGKTVNNFLKGFKQLSNKEVQVGHFDDQGLHSSGLTYVGLLKIWAAGLANGNEGNIQDPLAQFAFQDIMSGKFIKSAAFKKIIKNWYKGLDEAGAAERMTETVGILGEKKYKEIFNTVASPYMSNPANPTPMYETGELQSKVTHKVVNR